MPGWFRPLVVVLVVLVTALAALVTFTSSPTRVTETPIPDQADRTLLSEASHNAAFIDPPTGPRRMVDPTGETLWVAEGKLAGRVDCLGCPHGLRAGDPPGRIDATGSAIPADDLEGRLEVGGALVRRDGDALSVWIPTAEGHVDVGNLDVQTLDARRYAIAPQVTIAPDRRSLTAAIGLDDDREVGRVRLALLRAGSDPIVRVADLAVPGRSPSTCRPLPDGDARWGWVTDDASGDPGEGSASLRLASGPDLGPVRRFRRPYGNCTVTQDGYVLTTSASIPEGRISAVAWLDRNGRMVREVDRRGTDARSQISIATDGRVLVPSGQGFELMGASGPARSIAAEDALLADSGDLWVVRNGRARRIGRG